MGRDVRAGRNQFGSPKLWNAGIFFSRGGSWWRNVGTVMRQRQHHPWWNESNDGRRGRELQVATSNVRRRGPGKCGLCGLIALFDTWNTTSFARGCEYMRGGSPTKTTFFLANEEKILLCRGQERAHPVENPANLLNR